MRQKGKKVVYSSKTKLQKKPSETSLKGQEAAY